MNTYVWVLAVATEISLGCASSPLLLETEPLGDPVLVLAPLWQAAAEEGFCGEPRRLDGYVVEHRRARYVLPSYVRIEQGGVALFADEPSYPWLPPYNGLQYASFDRYLLLRSFATDCVDLDQRRLFVVSEDGSVIHQPIWTANWADGFFVADGRLTYWSEWFCHDEKRTEGKSYVYVFAPPRSSFERVKVEEDLYCPEAAGVTFIEFREAPTL